MRDQDKNRDPAKAKKRARSDFRCAANKLGPVDAVRALAAWIGSQADGDHSTETRLDLWLARALAELADKHESEGNPQ